MAAPPVGEGVVPPELLSWIPMLFCKKQRGQSIVSVFNRLLFSFAVPGSIAHNFFRTLWGINHSTHTLVNKLPRLA